MNNHYRQIVRLVCVGILMAAVLVMLVRRGAIPKFWVQKAEVMEPVKDSEIVEIPMPEEESGQKQQEDVSQTQQEDEDVTQTQQWEEPPVSEEHQQPEAEAMTRVYRQR